jgi:hypothetical protein
MSDIPADITEAAAKALNERYGASVEGWRMVGHSFAQVALAAVWTLVEAHWRTTIADEIRDHGWNQFKCIEVLDEAIRVARGVGQQRGTANER